MISLFMSGNLGQRGYDSPPSPYDFISDEFARSDNPSSMGILEMPVTPVLSWNPVIGTWGIISNAAYSSDATTSGPITFANALVSTIFVNIDLSVKCFQSSLDGGYIQVIYRFVSDTEYYYFQRNPLGDVLLYRTNGLDVATLGQFMAPSELDTFYQVRIVVVGNSHKLYINDTLVLDVIDFMPNTYSGTHGLGILSGSVVGSPGSRFKDFYLSAP